MIHSVRTRAAIIGVTFLLGFAALDGLTFAALALGITIGMLVADPGDDE